MWRTQGAQQRPQLPTATCLRTISSNCNFECISSTDSIRLCVPCVGAKANSGLVCSLLLSLALLLPMAPQQCDGIRYNHVPDLVLFSTAKLAHSKRRDARA